MAIGGRESYEWDKMFQDAYRTGGIEAEKAARQQYVDAYNKQNGFTQEPIPFGLGRQGEASAPTGGVFSVGGGNAQPPAQPTYNDGFSAGPGPANGGGGALGGAGGAQSNGSSSGLLGSVTPDQKAVDPSTMTVEGRIGNILATDQYGNFTNNVVKQASDRAMSQFASRGLLNSSMAQQAAQQAAISKAIEIAGPDAQTYFAQQGKNQDAVNVFRRAEQDNIYDTAKLNKQFELEWGKLNQQDKQFYAGLQSRMDELRLSNENQTLATQVALQNDLARQNNGAVQGQYDLFVRRLAQIDADTNLDAAAKAKQKQEAAANFKQIANYYGVMNNFDLNFGEQEPQP